MHCKISKWPGTKHTNFISRTVTIVCRKLKNELYSLRAKERKKKQQLSDWLKDTCGILLGYYVYFVTSNTPIPSVLCCFQFKMCEGVSCRCSPIMMYLCVSHSDYTVRMMFAIYLYISCCIYIVKVF
jgi:hypothetical protein